MTTYKTAEEFAAAINKYAAKKVKLIAKTVAAEAFRNVSQAIQEATPVLTGHARANWIPSVGEPDQGIIAGVAGVDVTGAPQTSVEKQAVEDQIKAFLTDDTADVLYLTNNLPYIQGLDDGNSLKAPGGMVLPSIHATLSALEDAGIK